MKEFDEFGKVDKGFEINYWNLSYRRKFIRTLIATPSVILAIIFIWWLSNSLIYKLIFTIIVISLELMQAIYTYSKWKL